MITREDWKALTLHKIEMVDKQLAHGHWSVAAEYMGYSLECALKAACCKALNIPGYPPVKPNNKEMGFFKTHEFDSLLIFSGLSEELGTHSMAWGIFTANFTGDWPQTMRYDINIDVKFTETLVRELYDVLYEREDSIIKTISEKQLW